MITDEQCERLRTALVGLRLRLLELDGRIAEDNEEARTSLTEAWRQFNAVARVIAPKLVAAADEDDVLEEV